MKIFTVSTVLALLTIAVLASAQTDFENAVKCGKRFPRVNQAIEKFCGKNKDGKIINDLVVPSKYAENGVVAVGLTGGDIWVNIKGTCLPAQWVPYNWCMAQFHALCAVSDIGYNNYNLHGKDNCQSFRIAILKP